MKKFVSVLLAVVMAFSVCSVAMIPAMAKDPVISPSQGLEDVDVIVKVNGEESKEVEYERNEEDPTEIKLTYTGPGNLLDWEFVPAEGDGVEIIERGDDYIIIKVDGNLDEVVANAVVESTEKPSIIVQVNGKDSDDIVYEKNEENPKEVTITYTGDGTVKDWEIIPEADGVKIEIIGTTEDSITIIVHDGDISEVVVNAIVKGATDKDTSKSPSTGAVATTGLVAAGVGVAVLSVLKKKNDAE